MTNRTKKIARRNRMSNAQRLCTIADNKKLVRCLFEDFGVTRLFIADDCVEDGYEPFGQEFDDRCESMWEDFYVPQLNRAMDKINRLGGAM